MDLCYNMDRKKEALREQDFLVEPLDGSIN